MVRCAAEPVARDTIYDRGSDALTVDEESFADAGFHPDDRPSTAASSCADRSPDLCMGSSAPRQDLQTFRSPPNQPVRETRRGAGPPGRHDDTVDMDELMVEVEAAFAATSIGMPRWADPHPPPDRLVADEEYSRVTNPARWRIIGARADAWIGAMAKLGVVTVERGADPRWAESTPPVVTRTDVVTPAIEGGLPLAVCRSRIEDVPDAGVTLGVGDPVVPVAFLPDCGCDACDSGSQDVLDLLDSYIRPIVTGEFRFLRRRTQSIMVLDEGRRQGSNIRLRDGVDAILADPRGWTEVSGRSWLAGPHGDMRH